MKHTPIYKPTHWILFILLLAVVFVQCTSKKKSNTQSKSPMIKNADIPFDSYGFRPDEEISISRATGTVIHIHPNSFRHADGSPVQDSIHFTAREFHTSGDIARSGIPMRIRNGSDDFLESAGMIEIHASSEGKELVLQENKNIEVDLASFKSSEGYQLYYLNDLNEWENKNAFTPRKNESKKTKLDSLSKIASDEKKPEFSDENKYFVLHGEIKSATYLKPFLDVEWKILDNISLEKIIQFKRLNWDEVNIRSVNRKDKSYRLRFKKTWKKENKEEITRIFEVNARPMSDDQHASLTDDDMDKMMKQYEEKMAKYESEKKRIQQEADMVNSFSVNKMGIWNCDRLINRDDILYSSVSFDFENKYPAEENDIKLFAIFTENNSVLSYARKDWSKIAFTKSGKMTLVAVLPDQKIAIVREQRIQEKLKGQNSTFNFNTELINQNDFVNTELMMITKR